MNNDFERLWNGYISKKKWQRSFHKDIITLIIILTEPFVRDTIYIT